ncbi:Actin-1 [Platanthera guangdongensis]|uniref:Actin-1 n=1 Tax=Platanthera guangdongensis TaxID=2320717 RepID=A0ABR2MWU8_9ASPA
MQMWISKAEYDESGPAIVHRKFGSQKNAEKLVLARNTESAAASIDCDATSGDEDDDDGTSDGDMSSLDKDEEDDSNSERALASKLCTFTSNGSNFGSSIGKQLATV